MDSVGIEVFKITYLLLKPIANRFKKYNKKAYIASINLKKAFDKAARYSSFKDHVKQYERTWKKTRVTKNSNSGK